MGVVTGNRTHKEPDGTKYIKPLADGTQKYGLIVESIYYLAECDGQVSKYIKEDKYIWKDANTRELVDEYISNSRGTSDFYNEVHLFVGEEKNKQRSIGVVLKDIRHRTRLSDAHYKRVKKKLMDYKMAKNPFKDFKRNFARLLERHQQMLNKLDIKRQELRQQPVKNKREEELKRKSGSKRRRLWKVISVATAAAVVALSVAAAVFMPSAPFSIISVCSALALLTNRSKDKTAAIKAGEKRAEAEEKLIEAEKKLAKAVKIVLSAEKSTFVTIEKMKEVKHLQRELIGVSSLIDRYIDISLTDKKELLSRVGDIIKEQKRFIGKLDHLDDYVGKCCDGLNERRKSLIA